MNKKTWYEVEVSTIVFFTGFVHYVSVKPFFTEEGYDSFLKLVRRGNATIVGKPQYKFMDFGKLTLCRCYLFLLVDLRNELPIIHVRAWQNDKLPLESLIQLNDFY